MAETSVQPTTMEPERLLARYQVDSAKEDPFYDGRAGPPVDAKRVMRMAIEENVQLFEVNSMTFLHRARHFIDPDDWDVLYRKNIRLFVNFVLGQYFSSPDFFSQLTWLNTEGSLIDKNSLAYDDVNDMMKKLCMFNNDSFLEIAYVGFATSLKKVSIPIKCKKDMAEILLFYPGRLNLNKQVEVERHLIQLVDNYFGQSQQVFPIEELYDFCSSLEAMSILFEQSNLVHPGLFPSAYAKDPTGGQVVIGYTSEEELWLEQTKQKVMKTADTQKVQSALLDDIINFTFFEGALSPNYGKKCFKIFWDSLWSVYLSYSEFQALSFSDKATIFLSTVRTVYAISCVFVDGMSTEEQAKIMFNSDDLKQNAFVQYMLGYTNQGTSNNRPQLRTLSFSDAYPELPMEEWNILREKVQYLVKDREKGLHCYVYLVVSAIFSGIPEEEYCKPKWRAFASLRKFHLLNCSRRFGSNYEHIVNHALLDFKKMGQMMDFLL